MKKKNQNKNILVRAGRYLKLLYLKLYRINDSPQKIALGFGLGVFLGAMPGAGVLAAIVLALLLRVNRISALLGAILTNTWTSFAIFLLSIRTGAAIMGLDWHTVYRNIRIVLKGFTWQSIFKISFFEILLPIVIGYFIISFCLGAAGYLIALALIRKVRNAKNKKRIDVSRQAKRRRDNLQPL